MRLMLTCAAAALLAAPAAAGPVAWTYHVETEYAADYGSRFQIIGAPGGRVVTETGPWDGTGHNLFGSTLDPRPLPGEYKTAVQLRHQRDDHRRRVRRVGDAPVRRVVLGGVVVPARGEGQPGQLAVGLGVVGVRAPVRSGPGPARGTCCTWSGPTAAARAQTPSGVLMVSTESVATPSRRRCARGVGARGGRAAAAVPRVDRVEPSRPDAGCG